VTGNDIIQIAEYALKANNPLITIPTLFFIVFLGYCAAKKFFNTGYIVTAQHQLNEDLQKEVERLNKRVEELIKENKELIEKLDRSCFRDDE